jgi:hypothetical protein
LSLLQTLDLGFNDNIRGSLPPGLNKLTQLQGLDLQRNQLVGGIPPEICELSFLRLLFLGFNQLNGNLPACIGDLQETTVFSVRATSLCHDEVECLDESLTFVSFSNIRSPTTCYLVKYLPRLPVW